MFPPVWGQNLAENIRRVWFLNNDIFRNEFKNCPIVYIPWENRSTLTPDFKRLLEILGVDVCKLRMITQPTHFQRIILPDESFYHVPGSMKFTNEYREAVDRVRNFGLKNITPISCKKFYFFHGGKWQTGEERLAEYLKSKGYEIIKGHEITFDEELNILVNCESFASTLGSAGQNSVFLRDGTEAIFIPRIAGQLLTTQNLINQIRLLNITYIDCTLSIFCKSVTSGFFFYIISEQLKRFFGDKWNGYEEEDLKNFLQYVKTSLDHGRESDPKVRIYYNRILSDFTKQLKQREDLIATYNIPLNLDKFKTSLAYSTLGWLNGSWKGGLNGLKIENEISNPLEQQFEIGAFRLFFPGYKVYCSVCFNEEEGWSSEVLAPEIVKSFDKIKPIMGMRVRLDEAGAKEFDILYRMHKFDGTWTPWAKNGEALYSHGQKVNAIQMKLEPINIQPNETEKEEFDDMYSPWVENEATIYLQGQRALIRAKAIKTQPDKTRTNEFDDVYTPWTKSDEKIYLQGQRVRRRAKIKKEVI